MPTEAEEGAVVQGHPGLLSYLPILCLSRQNKKKNKKRSTTAEEAPIT